MKNEFIYKRVLQLKFFKIKCFLKIMFVCFLFKTLRWDVGEAIIPFRCNLLYASDYQYRINVRAPEGDFNLTNSQSHN